MARKKYMAPLAFAGIISFQEYSNGWKVKPKHVIYFTLVIIIVNLLVYFLLFR
ncbi:MAG: preprotein translocase subunit Sec61beta [bacterium]|nr:preprotein translocase subunit Sec61beta [bacterium]